MSEWNNRIAPPLGPFESEYFQQWLRKGITQLVAGVTFVYASMQMAIKLCAELFDKMDKTVGDTSGILGDGSSLDAVNAAITTPDWLFYMECINYIFPLSETISFIISLLTIWGLAWAMRSILTTFRCMPKPTGKGIAW
jgi:hypothetical protein